MKLFYARVVASSPPDLHVSALRYTLRPNEQLTYVNPQLREFETLDARFRLADGKLTCEMKAHYSKAEEARSVVEPTLRAWEVDADLRYGKDALRFVFKGANIIDRTPAIGGEARLHLHVADIMTMSDIAVSAHITRGSYPEPPPSTFRLNPDAESVFFRYRGYLDGREPLTSMAYFCLTVLEAKAGGKNKRKNAAKLYAIDKAVLDKMGELSTVYGDRLTARKANPVRALTGPESTWLDAAVKMLIWRIGDTRNTSALPLITMADLPTT